MEQMDMFEPLHVALLRESQHYTEKAEPLIAKAKQLKAEAFALCPHEEIKSGIVSHDDEYGRYVEGWNEYHVECAFCGKSNWMGLKEFKAMGLTDYGLLQLGTETK